MPKAELKIELDKPSDYFEILEGDVQKDVKINMKTEDSKLIIEVEASTQKALITAISGTLKQIRIIEQTSELLKK